MMFLATLCVWSQKPHLYTMKQGLKNSYVNSIFVDFDNYLWAITDNSLEVFDGQRFIEIDCNDKTTGEPLFERVNLISQKDGDNYWVLSNKGLFVYDKKSNSISKINISGGSQSNSSSLTHAQVLPGNKQILFTSEGYGVFVIDNKTLQADSLLASKINSLLPDSYIYNVLVDSRGILWASGFDNCLAAINLKTKAKLNIDADEPTRKLMQDNHVSRFVEVNETGRIYMAMSNKGVLVYEPSTGKVRELKGNNHELYTTDIIYTKEKRIFIGTDNQGLFEIDLDTENIIPVDVKADGLNIRKAKIHALEEDVDGNIIAGIYQKGILVIPMKQGGFEYTPLSADETSNNCACVTSFCHGKDGTLWVGTDGEGVFVNGRNVKAGLSSLLVQTLVADESGTIWCGTWHGGIACSHDGQTFKTPEFLEEIRDYNVMDLAYDKSRGVLYAGTNGEGVLVIDIANKKISRIGGTNTFRWVNRLYLDHSGELWIGDHISLYHHDLDANKSEKVDINPNGTIIVNDMAEHGSVLLIATNKGVICYDRNKKAIVDEPFTKNIKKGINARNLLMKDGHLWMTDSKSIYSIDLVDATVKEYDSFNGYYIGQFHIRACEAAPDGDVLMGGDNGIIAFNPDQLLKMPQNIKQVFLSPIWLGDELSGDNSYHIAFSVPEIAWQERINYAYILDGYEKEWHVINQGTPEAYYASLPPGSYTFRVRAYYTDFPEQHTEQAITVKVPYPWYATWWAYLLYIAVAAAVALYVYNNIRERQRQRAMLKEAERNEQIKEDKLRLFTSIAHELRAPLTMIVSPLRQLIMNDHNLERQGNYSIMQRNCNRLLRTVNQMLDIRKIEKGQFNLHLSQTNLNTYVKEIMESFKGMAAAKAITYTHETEKNDIQAWIDTTHFEKIIFNLLSNAFKFTPANGAVIVRTSTAPNSQEGSDKRVIDDDRINEYAEIRVYNSGSHIAPKDLEHLWERFYQGASKSKDGSGIGLNLASELVKLHHGVIEAQNVGNDGVEFVVRIPLGNTHLTEEDMSEAPEEPASIAELIVRQPAGPITQPTPTADIDMGDETDTMEPDGNENSDDSGDTDGDYEMPVYDETTHILIVDDDNELCQYVASELGKEYKVDTSNSGNQAWVEIIKKRPPIVITDLMMPDGDGYELCRRIKANPETDNTAVIVLTSESGDENRLRAMNVQADHFLPKPFNLPLLRSAIAQVTKVRENVRNKMKRTEIGNSLGSIDIESYDEKFLQGVKDAILENIDDTEFNVNELSKAVSISRVHLNRKMKELLGISPNAYIKTIRLKQAAYLLVNNKVNVSEVAYRIGFSSHSHFSSSFHAFFGMSPKEFVATYSENLNDETLRKLLE